MTQRRLYAIKISFGQCGRVFSLIALKLSRNINILTPWQGRPTLKPTASTVSTRSGSGRPPPGVLLMNGHLMTTTTTPPPPYLQANVLRGFSTDLLQTWTHHRYDLGGCNRGSEIFATSWRHDVVTSRKFVLATVGAFFDRFASNLVETCIWHGRVVSCEKKRHDVTTSWRYDVITSFLAVFWPL